MFLSTPVFRIFLTLPPVCQTRQPEQGKVVNSLLFIALDNSTFGEEFAITREDIYEITTSEGLAPQLSVMAAYKSPGDQGGSQV